MCSQTREQRKGEFKFEKEIKTIAVLWNYQKKKKRTALKGLLSNSVSKSEQ